MLLEILISNNESCIMQYFLDLYHRTLSEMLEID